VVYKQFCTLNKCGEGKTTARSGWQSFPSNGLPASYSAAINACLGSVQDRQDPVLCIFCGLSKGENRNLSLLCLQATCHLGHSHMEMGGRSIIKTITYELGEGMSGLERGAKPDRNGAHAGEWARRG